MPRSLDKMPQSSKWIREITPSDNVCKASCVTLAARFCGVVRYVHCLAGRSTLAVEDVHQLRVWTRRLNAALDFYRDVLPAKRRKKTKQLLKEIRDAAGPTRDLDVLIQRLESEPSDPRAVCFKSRIQCDRLLAQQSLSDLAARLISEQCLQRRLQKLLKGIGKRNAAAARICSQRFDDWARQQLRVYVKRFFRSEPPRNASVPSLHQFRIEGKKLRYTIELAAGAFPRKLRKSHYPEIVELQDILGRLTDLSVAEECFREQRECADDARLVEYFGELMRADKSRQQQAQNDYHQFWTPQRRRRLKKQFRKLLKG